MHIDRKSSNKTHLAVFFDFSLSKLGEWRRSVAGQTVLMAFIMNKMNEVLKAIYNWTDENECTIKRKKIQRSTHCFFRCRLGLREVLADDVILLSNSTVLIARAFFRSITTEPLTSFEAKGIRGNSPTAKGRSQVRQREQALYRPTGWRARIIGGLVVVSPCSPHLK